MALGPAEAELLGIIPDEDNSMSRIDGRTAKVALFDPHYFFDLLLTKYYVLGRYERGEAGGSSKSNTTRSKQLVVVFCYCCA
mmetsp:Transcript_11353/g.18883  ORF Transcript_11353/g.18883 Transcript_11353/m.18883 type:complete len:82 (-) Transcript_11353:71-316(-)